MCTLYSFLSSGPSLPLRKTSYVIILNSLVFKSFLLRIAVEVIRKFNLLGGVNYDSTKFNYFVSIYSFQRDKTFRYTLFRIKLTYALQVKSKKLIRKDSNAHSKPQKEIAHK